MGFKIADFRLQIWKTSAEGDDKPLISGLKPSGFWSVYASLKARSSTVLDVSHGAGQQASRALYLAALTARLKSRPSTTVPIPAFLRNLLSRAFPERHL